MSSDPFSFPVPVSAPDSALSASPAASASASAVAAASPSKRKRSVGRPANPSSAKRSQPAADSTSSIQSPSKPLAAAAASNSPSRPISSTSSQLPIPSPPSLESLSHNAAAAIFLGLQADFYGRPTPQRSFFFSPFKEAIPRHCLRFSFSREGFDGSAAGELIQFEFSVKIWDSLTHRNCHRTMDLNRVWTQKCVSDGRLVGRMDQVGPALVDYAVQDYSDASLIILPHCNRVDPTQQSKRTTTGNFCPVSVARADPADHSALLVHLISVSHDMNDPNPASQLGQANLVCLQPNKFYQVQYPLDWVLHRVDLRTADGNSPQIPFSKHLSELESIRSEWLRLLSAEFRLCRQKEGKINPDELDQTAKTPVKKQAKQNEIEKPMENPNETASEIPPTDENQPPPSAAENEEIKSAVKSDKKKRAPAKSKSASKTENAEANSIAEIIPVSDPNVNEFDYSLQLPVCFPDSIYRSDKKYYFQAEEILSEILIYAQSVDKAANPMKDEPSSALELPSQHHAAVYSRLSVSGVLSELFSRFLLKPFTRFHSTWDAAKARLSSLTAVKYPSSIYGFDLKIVSKVVETVYHFISLHRLNLDYSTAIDWFWVSAQLQAWINLSPSECRAIWRYAAYEMNDAGFGKAPKLDASNEPEFDYESDIEAELPNTRPAPVQAFRDSINILMTPIAPPHPDKSAMVGDCYNGDWSPKMDARLLAAVLKWKTIKDKEKRKSAVLSDSTQSPLPQSVHDFQSIASLMPVTLSSMCTVNFLRARLSLLSHSAIYQYYSPDSYTEFGIDPPAKTMLKIFNAPIENEYDIIAANMAISGRGEIKDRRRSEKNKLRIIAARESQQNKSQAADEAESFKEESKESMDANNPLVNSIHVSAEQTSSIPSSAPSVIVSDKQLNSLPPASSSPIAEMKMDENQ